MIGAKKLQGGAKNLTGGGQKFVHATLEMIAQPPEQIPVYAPGFNAYWIKGVNGRGSI